MSDAEAKLHAVVAYCEVRIAAFRDLEAKALAANTFNHAATIAREALEAVHKVATGGS